MIRDIDLNIHNINVDQSTAGIRWTTAHNTNATNKFKFFLFESPETETNLKVATFGIHLNKHATSYRMISLPWLVID